MQIILICIYELDGQDIRKAVQSWWIILSDQKDMNHECGGYETPGSKRATTGA